MTEEISITKKIGPDIYKKENQSLVFSEGLIINSKYRIIEKIGSGGFGVVYKANDLILQKEIAIKFLNPEYIDSAKKFHRVKREINISRKITDKRLVKIYSLEKYNGIHLLVMEYVQGRSLKDQLEEDKVIAWRKFRPIFINIMRGVKALHDQGIIHRDLKPSNIMLIGGDDIKILDFGMSKEIDDLERTSSVGELIGSPYYMSPEQANMGEVDMRSDIYQLGLVLYRVLSGSMPFGDSQSTFEIIFKRILEKPDKIDRKTINIPKYTEFGIFKAIEKRGENRFKSIDVMISFFEKGNYSLFRKVFHNIKKFKWRIVLLTALSLTIICFFIFWIADSNVSSVKFNQSNITAYNNLGVGLWEKNVSPYTINTSFILDNNIGVEANTNRNNFSIDSRKIITLLNNHDSVDNVSILSCEFDNKVSIFTNDGRELAKVGFSEFFNLGKYDFVKKFYASKIISNDIDQDGRIERILFIRHFMDMYPTAFVFIKDSNIYSFSNPGTISEYVFLEPDEKNIRILMFGVNNIVSHLFFVAEIQFPLNGNFRIKQTSIPNLKQSNNYIPEFLSFIPNFSSYSSSEWDKSGLLKFKDYWTGDSIAISKDFKMTVSDGSNIRTFSDNRVTLYRIYKLINQYYVEKLINRNYKHAYELIVQSIAAGPENPYLRSALFFFKGDLEIDRGNFRQGRESLEQSIEYFKYNRDAAQRLSEADFLEGSPDAAYRRVNEELGHINQFWGISSGKEIFKSYCMLQTGNFSKAREILSLSVFKSNLSDGNAFLGLLKLFTGEYTECLNILSQPDNNRTFTIAEWRLFLGRAMVLAGSDLKKAEFYFDDISLNSISLSILAKMSNYYLKLSRGVENINPEKIINEFNSLVDLSKGNFQARLWLFYDAYIYGKMMELLNNRTEAVRGYKLSVQSNPYTELAKRAEKRISELRSK